MSVRVYKIMAAGGFLLEEYCDGIDQWFDNIKEFPIDVYDSKESCLNKINYWIDNDYRRNIKAEIGRRLVTEDHTYLHRIETALSYYYIWKENNK
jgi:spore maturation protein CgeB